MRPTIELQGTGLRQAPPIYSCDEAVSFSDNKHSRRGDTPYPFMATIQDRSFSRTYDGLKNQFAVAGVLAALCLVGYELMRRRRRGRGRYPRYSEELGSVETWEFGYLYQGRCWAKMPSPALPKFPLQWIIQALSYPEPRLPELIGVDATMYIRFLRGCRQFVSLHTITTFPILFTIHIVFSPSNVPLNSMDKASVSSLVPSEQRLLFVHVILAYWIAMTWVINLLWIARDTFHYRAVVVQTLKEKYSEETITSLDDIKDRGLRLRTVMVTNIPVSLRNEKDLREYFEYYLSRPLAKPPIAFSFFTRLTMLVYHRIATSSTIKRFKAIPEDVSPHDQNGEDHNTSSYVVVERVSITRKMTELASLLERRDTILKELELAHIRLAQQVLQAVRDGLDVPDQELTKEEKEIFATLAPFVKQFHVPSSQRVQSILARIKRVGQSFFGSNVGETPGDFETGKTSGYTIWETLHSFPRSHLDQYQPLIRLNKLFLGKPVPEIDYYTAKLAYLTSLIHDDKSRPIGDYQPTSTAFVTFLKVEDARRAAKYLQTHPSNPLACLVVPAPDVRDLDWARIMKSSFTGEFIKDWVIDAGVWIFTLCWIIPISLLIGLVNIQNLGVVLPGLAHYFDEHPHDKEAITSLLPTIIFSLLTILIPVLLLLIGKKGHTIITFTKLHDTIMVRYWKFLVCNLLIFFCVGVAAFESFLQFFKNAVDFIPVIASSFPIAGPFYVGWLILQTAIHGFLELGLFGLPLLVYPYTKAAKTVRRRAEGIHPRTFNFYYWLPNHLLVVTIVLLFSLLNPLIIPFALVYFCVESVIVKHQLLHVYSRTYEHNGKLLLIRMVRFSLDGLILAHVVFLAFLVVLKETPEAVFIGLLLVLTVITKLGLTRFCRIRFGEADKAEAAIFDANGLHNPTEPSVPPELRYGDAPHDQGGVLNEASAQQRLRGETLGHPPFLKLDGEKDLVRWKEAPKGAQFNYASYPPRRQFNTQRPVNPFLTAEHESSVLRPEEKEGSRQGLTLSEEPEQQQITPTSGSSPFGNRQFSKRTSNVVVTPHPPFPSWDDSPNLDQPYDNPYYTAPVENILWLPRNPFGQLDLDDTVDLHVTLTSQGNSGELDRWLEEGEGKEVPLSESPRMSLVENAEAFTQPVRTDSGRTGSSISKFRPQRQYTGMENISMSSVLAARANALEKENNDKRRRMMVMRGIRKDLDDVNNDSKLREVVSLDTIDLAQRRPRLHSRTYDPVHEPDLHAESTPLRERIVLESPPVDGATSQNVIPLEEAVLSEVVAEEKHHALERIRREAMEKMHQGKYRPAWWKWLFWHIGDQPHAEHQKETV